MIYCCSRFPTDRECGSGTLTISSVVHSRLIARDTREVIGFSNSCDVSTRGRCRRGRRDNSMPSLGTFMEAEEVE